MTHRDTGSGTATAELGHLSQGRTRASVSGVFWSFVQVGFGTVLAAVVFAIVSRVLSPEDFGAVSMATAIVLIASAIAPIAFGEALIQREEIDSRHLDSAFWFTTVFCLAFYAVLAFGAPLIGRLVGAGSIAVILPVLALRLIFEGLLAVPFALVTRRMQFRYIAFRTIIANGLGAVVCLLLAFQGFALWALVLQQLTTSLANLVVTAIAAQWRPGFALSLSALRDLRYFGLYAMGNRMMNQARIDQFLMGLVLGPAALGLYFFAQKLTEMLRNLTVGMFSPVSNVLFASLQSDVEKRRIAFTKALFAVGAFNLPVFGGLIALAPTAVPTVFGSQWTEAIPAVQALAVMGILGGIGTLQAAVIRNLGESGWWFWFQTGLRLTEFALILAVFPLGLNAVIAASLIRMVLIWPLSVRKTRVMLDLERGAYLTTLAAPAAATVAAIAGVLAFPALVPGLSAKALLASQLGLGLVLYTVVLIAGARPQITEILNIARTRGKSAGPKRVSA